jgi:xylulokinase
MGAALGLGLATGTAVVSLGTSGTAYTVADAPTADDTGAVAGFADATGRFLPLVCTLNATKVTDAVRRLLGVDHDEFDALALASPSGAGGLVLLPYLDGERTPDRPKATGVLAGLRSDVFREQVARAAIEGVACGMLDALDALRAVAPVHEVVLVGGGARSTAMRTVFASMCDLPVFIADADEAVATGACVQAAAVALGVDHAEVQRRWEVGARHAVDRRRADVAATDDVRARYAERRDRES